MAVVRTLAGLALVGSAVLLGQADMVRANVPGSGTLPVVTGYTAPDQRVIVILKNQHPELAGRFAVQARADTLHREQAPILADLLRAHATHVVTFHLINGIATTVSTAEVDRLRANAAVAAIVPDRALHMPSMNRLKENPIGTGSASSVTANSAYTCPAMPTLEPEALSLTNTLSVPGTITGAGVKVAFMADGLDINNLDFIRPNGSHVIVDYKDFSGDGTAAPTASLEAFGDAGSLGAQGKKTYDVYSYVVPKHTGKCLIKIRGMAPGADLLSLKIFGSAGAGESQEIEAIQYAVDQHVDVISQSFAISQYPVQSADPLMLAENAAIANGVTMLASSGDSGPTNTSSLVPAGDPGVISVGATTQFRAYAQDGFSGFPLSKGGWISNNIAPLSSGGFTPAGTRSVDVVAPGDSAWVPCTGNAAVYADCTNAAGKPSSFVPFGGTSESCPFTAGEAALIIQAYRQTHKGQSPTPALVKQIITGTADDLGIPSNLQGAGLIDSVRAVQAARSVKTPNSTSAPQGAALLTSASALTATDAPNKIESFPITVTNGGAATESVRPSARTLSPPTTLKASTLTLDHTKPPTFTSEYGDKVAYTTQTFTVPTGVQRLQAAISWDVVGQPQSKVRLELLDPQGSFAQLDDPDDSSGYGRADVRNPAPGTWTAAVWTYAVSTRTYTGPVHLTVTSSHFVPVKLAQQVSAIQLNPGQSKLLTIKIGTPTAAGDFNGDVILTGTASRQQSITTVLPLYLRSLIQLGPSGGTFGGILAGGNGRITGHPSVSYAFDVPPGQRDLDLGISLADSHYNLSGFLVNPSGVPVEAQSTITALQSFQPTAFTNTMQFFHRDPMAGRWTFIMLINNTVSGAQTSLPFTGTITFNGVNVQSSGLPNDPNVMLTSGQPVTATITITNTGNTTKSFFPDARLTTSQPHIVRTVDEVLNDATHPSLTVVVVGAPPVPPETSDLAITSTSPDGPMTLDTQYIGGGIPQGNAGVPRLGAVAQLDQSTGLYTATTDYSSPDVSSGVWGSFISESGTFGPNPGPTEHVHTQAFLTTENWDNSIVSDTGDQWATLYGISQPSFTPLTLAPGAQGTIHLTITPSGTSGTVVQGHIFIDTLSLSGGYDTNYFSGDELVAIPYVYKVG